MQVLAHLPHHRGDSEIAHDIEPHLRRGDVAVRQCERRPVLLRELLADRHQVVAAILQSARHFVGKIRFAERRADRLQVAPIGSPCERGDLRAGVVDIEFLGDLVARLRKQVGQRVADDGTAAMADMHRAGWICRDVFDVDADALADAVVTVGNAGAQHVRKPRTKHRWIKDQIDEARPGGACLRQAGRLRKIFDDGGCKFRRWLACGLRRHERGIGGHVAMCRIAVRGDLDACGDAIRQIGDDASQRRQYRVAHLGINIARHSWPLLLSSWAGLARPFSTSCVQKSCVAWPGPTMTIRST